MQTIAQQTELLEELAQRHTAIYAAIYKTTEIEMYRRLKLLNDCGMIESGPANTKILLHMDRFLNMQSAKLEKIRGAWASAFRKLKPTNYARVFQMTMFADLPDRATLLRGYHREYLRVIRELT